MMRAKVISIGSVVNKAERTGLLLLDEVRFPSSGLIAGSEWVQLKESVGGFLV